MRAHREEIRPSYSRPEREMPNPNSCRLSAADTQHRHSQMCCVNWIMQSSTSLQKDCLLDEIYEHLALAALSVQVTTYSQLKAWVRKVARPSRGKRLR